MHICINPPKETLFFFSFHPLHSCVPDKEREARFIRQEAKVGHKCDPSTQEEGLQAEDPASNIKKK